MDRDARRMRGERPFVFTNLKSGDGVDRIVDFVVAQGGLPNGATAPDTPESLAPPAGRGPG